MVTKTLPEVTTPLVLFNEADVSLTRDPIEWDGIKEAILSGQANVVRFHHEKLVLEPHEHLMVGPVEQVCGVPMRKTIQWSGRDHLASTAFYRQMLDQYSREEARAFIEHQVYGKLIEDYERDGLLGWQSRWRVWMYHPESPHIQRSWDQNGRQGDPVVESVF
jgi:hypothetical protein